MKNIFVMLLIFLLSFPLISAVEFDLNHSFGRGETMIAKVSGNFLAPITMDNVLFYQGHVRIPMEYGVFGINNDFYIYALLSKPAGNYSMSIQDVQYMKGSEISSDNLEENFSITNETADFSVNPGVIVTPADFSLEIQNLQDSPIIIDINTAENNSEEREILIFGNSTETSVPLYSGETKEINFNVGIGEPAFRAITLKTGNFTYEIPVYISNSLEGNQEPATFSLEPSGLVYSFSTDSIVKKIVYLYNTGNIEMKNISISLDNSLSQFANLSQTSIADLKANSNIPIEITFFSLMDTSALGNLKAKVGDNIAYSSISLRFIRNYTASPNVTILQSSAKSCSELQGKVCNNSIETCSQEPIYATDNVCCMGTCNKIQNDNSNYTLMGIVILIFIVLVLIWFYFKKYKKAKKSINLVDIAKRKPQSRL
jgi:hypothetical protein